MKATDSNNLAILIEQMAAQASLPNMLTSGPSLPGGWVNLNMFSQGAPPSYPYVPTQGFLAKGPIDGSGTMGAVLALGMPWPSYLANQYDGRWTQSPLPASIAGSASIPGTQQIFSPYVIAYDALRKPLWDSLALLGGLPLYIGGMGLGGPIAQIAALDLRPGNTGPKSGQYAPNVQPPCYAFSTGNVATQDMASYYNSLVKNSQVFQAGSNVLPVDFFPTSPNNDSFAPLGTTVTLQARIPSTDVPWYERSDLFYLMTLGGVAQPGVATPTAIPNPPAGFSQSRAYSFSLLTAAAYQLTQHPASIVNTSPYTLVKAIQSGGTNFAYVFSSTDSVVVAIRGCITWQEFNGFTANSNFSYPTFMPDVTALVQSGAYAVYSAPVANGDATLFSEALRATVKVLMEGGGKSLYITGHSLGGAIANIAAADLVISQTCAVAGVYTFGSTMVANPQFQTAFDAAVGTQSYQILRLNDKIATAIFMLGYIPLSNQLSLLGELQYDESTYHSLYGYLNLLNPSRNLNN